MVTQEEDDEEKKAHIQVFVDKAKVWLPFETLSFKACVSGTSRADLKIDDFNTLPLLWRLKLIGRWRDNVCLIFRFPIISTHHQNCLGKLHKEIKITEPVISALMRCSLPNLFHIKCL